MSTTENKTTEKKVKIRLPISREQKDDVFVAVNGRTWLIKRGEEVEVPECVVEVLRHQEEALAHAYDYQAAMESK
jgi:hypothetical protein